MDKYKLFDRVVLQLPILIVLFFISVLYLGLYYDAAISNNYNNIYEVGKLVNLHDHSIYLKELRSLDEHGIRYGFNNDVGIALIYYVMYVGSGISSVLNIYIFSFIVNIVFLWLSFYYYNKICSKHRLSDLACVLFFFNCSFVYFTQLINKDMLTIFILLYTLYFGIKGKFMYIVIMLPVAFLVRQQLALCMLTFVFLLKVKHTFFWLVISYIISSLAAGYISAHLNLISQESMGSGFSSFLMSLNSQFYIGNLFLNPIRLLQYFFSAPQSLLYTYSDSRVDLAAVLRVLTIPLVFFAVVFISRSLLNLKRTINTEIKPYFLLTYSFFLCWLLNPTINARYLMLILPVMVLGYCFQSKVVKGNGS